MFRSASAFDQDLGWCVDDDVDFDLYGQGLTLQDAFDGTPCASTSCGVVQGTCAPSSAPTPRPETIYGLDDSNIRTAVTAWLSDAAAAEATYGHISTWETGGVTNMAYLFCACSYCSNCNTAAASFNEDIGAWDISGVTTMWYMFYYASSFNQDLGWCVDGMVFLERAFEHTQCESTACGVVQCPKKNKKEQTPVAVIAGAGAAAALLLIVGAFCFYRRRKASMMDKADEPSGSLPKSNPEPTEFPPPEEATPPKETEAPAVIPKAEESPQETPVDEPPPPPAKSWFGRAEPEPESEEAKRPQPPAKSWSFWRAEPESEEAEPPPPLSPFSALRAERERELKALASP